MIGIDILEVERIRKLCKNLSAKQKTFTAGEIEYAEKMKCPEINYTGFFCAKESVIKALEGGSIKEIEVCHKPNGAPYVVLSGKTKQLFENNYTNIYISISHINDYATAICQVK